MQVLSVDFADENAQKLFTKSLKETGFAVIKNHPISHELIQQVYEDWKQFFADERKREYLCDGKTLDGYVSPDVSEIARGYGVKDLKEFFSVFETGKFPEFLGPATRQLSKELVELAAILLQWIEEATPKEIRDKFSMPLNEMIEDGSRHLLRIVHYPPLTGDEEEGAVRAAEHEDSNLMTLLPSATSQGLQIKDSAGNWHDVPCDFNSISVNTGDMLKICSQGYYPSTSHRVCNPIGALAKESRYSMPLFLHPHFDVRLSDEYTAKEYWLERMREHGVITD